MKQQYEVLAKLQLDAAAYRISVEKQCRLEGKKWTEEALVTILIEMNLHHQAFLAFDTVAALRMQRLLEIAIDYHLELGYSALSQQIFNLLTSVTESRYSREQKKRNDPHGYKIQQSACAGIGISLKALFPGAPA